MSSGSSTGVRTRTGPTWCSSTWAAAACGTCSINNVKLSQAQAARLGVEAAQGLAYAHARGLVHRDVKPANLLFDEEGRVRIADFGVARALAEAAWTEPVGAVVGTARYASPEQAEGRNVDGRADVYSLALVLYEAVTGVVPFVVDTTVGTLMARVGQPLPSHRLLGPLDAVLARAAAPEAEARLTATQLGDRLEAVAAGLAPPVRLPLKLTAAGGSATVPAGIPPQVVPNDLTAVSLAGTGATAAPTAAAPRAHAGPGEVFDVEALEGSGPGAGWSPPASVPIVRRRRRRRWPWVAAVLVVVAAVVAGLLVARAEKVFTPSHHVPALSGLTLVQARHALAADHFVLAVGPASYSTTVAEGLIIGQHPAPTESLKEGSTVRVVPSKGPPSVAVPSLLGVDCSVATRLLSEAHLKVACPAVSAYSATTPVGQVLNWSYDNKLNPVSAPYGATILVAISKGPPPVPIPAGLAGGSFTAAQSALVALGFTVTQAQESSTQYPAGQVTRTAPAAGVAAPVGSAVTVYVSTGPPIVSIPNVSGDTVTQATAALGQVGLSVGQVYGPSGGKVFTSDPLAGQQLPAGQSVNLYTQ